MEHLISPKYPQPKEGQKQVKSKHKSCWGILQDFPKRGTHPQPTWSWFVSAGSASPTAGDENHRHYSSAWKQLISLARGTNTVWVKGKSWAMSRPYRIQEATRNTLALGQAPNPQPPGHSQPGPADTMAAPQCCSQGRVCTAGPARVMGNNFTDLDTWAKHSSVNCKTHAAIFFHSDNRICEQGSRLMKRFFFF